MSRLLAFAPHAYIDKHIPGAVAKSVVPESDPLFVALGITSAWTEVEGNAMVMTMAQQHFEANDVLYRIIP